MVKNMGVIGNSTNQEDTNREKFYELFKSSPIPEGELLQNLGLYINRQLLSRILFMHCYYLLIMSSHNYLLIMSK